MLQTRFSIIQISHEKRENLNKKLKEIFRNIRNRFKNFGVFQNVVAESSNYHSKDLKDEQTPEEFAKRNLIEPLIDLLGIVTIPETILPSPGGRKKPDYILRPKDMEYPILYVEAEPLNLDLHSKTDLERELRSFIEERMKKHFGEKWWEQRVPPDVRMNAEERKKKDHESGRISETLTNHLDFSDYAKIILGPDNWKDLFAPIFKTPEKIKVWLDEIREIRNSIMHSRKITEEEKRTLDSNIKKIRKCITLYNNLP